MANVKNAPNPAMCVALGAQVSNGLDVSFGNLREDRVLTKRNSGPPLGNFIGYIICLRSKKQMPRVAAWRVVTSMAHEHPVRDVPLSKTPCDAACRNIFPFDRLESVAASPAPTFPWPAGFLSSVFVNLVPKSLRYCFKFEHAEPNKPAIMNAAQALPSFPSNIFRAPRRGTGHFVFISNNSLRQIGGAVGLEPRMMHGAEALCVMLACAIRYGAEFVHVKLSPYVQILNPAKG